MNGGVPFYQWKRSFRQRSGESVRPDDFDRFLPEYFILKNPRPTYRISPFPRDPNLQEESTTLPCKEKDVLPFSSKRR